MSKFKFLSNAVLNYLKQMTLISPNAKGAITIKANILRNIAICGVKEAMAITMKAAMQIAQTMTILYKKSIKFILTPLFLSHYIKNQAKSK